MELGDHELDRGGRKFKYIENNGLIIRKRDTLTSDNKGLENDTLIVLPKPCRLAVLKLAHESPVAGYFGHRKTEMKIKREFYWPGMTTRHQIILSVM